MKRLVTFEVDDKVLFDAISKMSGDCSSLGARIFEALLAGTVDIGTSFGLAVYGIVLTETKPATQPEHPSTAIKTGGDHNG